MFEELKEYLHNNYLPEPDDIYESYEFSCRHDYDEQTNRPCGFDITITFKHNDFVESVMRKYLADLGLNVNPNNYFYFDSIVAFLHELGHVATLPHLHEEKLKENQILTTMLEIFLEETVNPGKFFTNEYIDKLNRSCIAYWNTPVEKAANEWIVNILNSFPNIMDDLETIFLFHCGIDKI